MADTVQHCRHCGCGTWHKDEVCEWSDGHPPISVDMTEDRKPHKVMTAEEYSAMPIVGWHEVCRDVDEFGGVGVRFLGESMATSSLRPERAIPAAPDVSTPVQRPGE